MIHLCPVKLNVDYKVAMVTVNNIPLGIIVFVIDTK